MIVSRTEPWIIGMVERTLCRKVRWVGCEELGRLLQRTFSKPIHTMMNRRIGSRFVKSCSDKKSKVIGMDIIDNQQCAQSLL